MKALRSTLQDTWRGLMARRLWPVAVALVGALVAVPLVLGADEPAPAGSGAEQAAAARVTDLSTSPIVASASAEERDSARRVLGSRKDPFKPAPGAGKKAGEEAEKASEAKAERASQGSSDSGSGSGGSGGSGGAGTTPAPAPARVAPIATPSPSGEVQPEYKTYSVTVRWGSSDDDELERGNVERLHALPSAEDPVVIYLGLTDDGKAAVFLVDESATPVGDGRCRPDPANCQTIELRRGETEFFDVDAGDGQVAQYQLDVVRIHAKKVTSAKAARRARTAEAFNGRRALKAISAARPAYRFDADTGLLLRRPARG